MKVKNKHTAALTPPGGKHLEPGAVGDAKDGHPVTKAWLEAGLLELVDAAPVEAAQVDPPADAGEPKQKGSRK